MTDIDALISHLMSEHVTSCVSIGRDPGLCGSRWTNYIDAIYAERALSARLASAIEEYQNATPRHDWFGALDDALTLYTKARENKNE